MYAAAQNESRHTTVTVAFFSQNRVVMAVRRLLALFALVPVLTVAAACHDTPQPTGAISPAPADSTQTDAAPSTAPDAPPDPSPRQKDVTSKDLVISTPARGASATTNPIRVTGRVRTFENNVHLRLLDADGKHISTTISTARGDMGTLNPFEAELWITRDPGDHVTIELVEYSARDGSLRARATRPLDLGMPLRRETLYFPLDNPGNDCSRVVPVSRDIPAADGRIQLLVQALIAGPTDAEHMEYDVTGPFPQGSALRGVNLSRSRAIVDLNERLSNVGGACRATAIRAAIEKTLTDLETVDSVEIRANGSAETALQP